MSAYLVSDATMHDAVAEILDLASRRWIGFADLDHVGQEDGTAIGRHLFRLNHLALSGRYGDAMPEAIDYVHQPRAASRDRMVRFKALKCLRYQCSEDPAMKEAIFAELHALSGESAEVLVHERLSAAYDAAPWGRL